MRKLTTIICSIIIGLCINNTKAQDIKQKDTIIIKTSTECNMCKERVERDMAFTKGVISASLNVEKSELTVTYKTHKTSPEKIRIAVSKTGYDADHIKANEKAYKRLPDCCKKGGMEH